MNLDILSMHGYGTNYVKTAFLYLNGQSRTADERLSSDIRIGRVTEKNRSEKKKIPETLQSAAARDGCFVGGSVAEPCENNETSGSM
jgi:hypothetical protein